MADILSIRARENGGGAIGWSFVDETMVGYTIVLDQPPTAKIRDGDIWQVELVHQTRQRQRKIAVVRLVARLQEMKPWERVTELPGHWTDPLDLKCLLIWLHRGKDFILVGPKGTGKTTLVFALAEALGWQEPCKVDVGIIQTTTHIFGSEAALKGTTYFRRSALFDYIERARIAFEHGIDTLFIVLLDEINRAHAKMNESMHGLFDDTRQITLTTSEGSKIVRLPPNLHTVGTMNVGAEYVGTFQLDEALKSRFMLMRVRPMPEDEEVKRLMAAEGVLETQALSIVKVAAALRGAANARQIGFAPDFRTCRGVAVLVRHGLDLRTAVIKGFLAYYEGDLSFTDKGEVVQPNSEVAKAFSALRMNVRGFVHVRNGVKEVV